MAARDHLNGHQFPVITQEEARGNSRPVSYDEFQDLARAGHRYVRGTQRGRSTAGMDAHWASIRDRAYELAREPWGGATINGRTGRLLGDSAEEVSAKTSEDKGFGRGDYALSNRAPGEEQIQLPTDVSREHFHAAMDRAKAIYPQIGNRGGHLGVFHDADEKRIDVDPILVVHTPEKVEQVGAYTHAVGGAYHFQSGNGYFPPHVKREG